jgi:quercetin dioxygenase-like cupin family protein
MVWLVAKGHSPSQTAPAPDSACDGGLQLCGNVSKSASTKISMGLQMTSDKAKRDALNNERFKDIYIHASQEPWLQFYPGVGFKLLRATQETGHWTVLLNCAKGSSIPRHEHLGAGEYYVISGKMEVRGGVENGGITAITGDYGYEPNGVIHDMTNFPEDTVIYFTNFGPIRYIDDDNNTVGFLDWQGVLKAAEVLMMASHQPLPPPDGR